MIKMELKPLFLLFHVPFVAMLGHEKREYKIYLNLKLS